MRVVITSNGAGLDSPLNETFGRCPTFVFVDTETMEHEAVANSAAGAPSGAGIQAAELVAGADVKAVITGRVGPKAMNVLDAAGIEIYPVKAKGGTVLQAVEEFKAERTGSPPRTKKEQIQTLEAEVAGLRQKLSQLVEKIEHVKGER